MKKLIITILSLLVAGITVQAEELVIPIHLTDSAGVGSAIGTVKASSNPYGTVLTPDLKDLTPGLHGLQAPTKKATSVICPPCMLLQMVKPTIPYLLRVSSYPISKAGR
jgi:Cu-Zn family superoxide dismutase